jgi:hypothetical protein
MMRSTILALLVASASAFAPASMVCLDLFDSTYPLLILQRNDGVVLESFKALIVYGDIFANECVSFSFFCSSPSGLLFP